MIVAISIVWGLVAFCICAIVGVVLFGKKR